MRKLLLSFLIFTSFFANADGYFDPETGQQVNRSAVIRGFVPEFLVEVNKGNVQDHEMVHKFGWNNTITTTHHHVWNDPTTGGSDLIWQQTAAHYDVYSDDIDDDGDPADTGALTVTLECLDANFSTVFQTLTLNGTTAVTTTESTCVRLQRAYIATVGTYSGSNEGDIRIEVTSGGSKTGDLQGFIEAEEGQTQKSQYTVPAGKTAYVLRISHTIEAQKTFTTELHTRENADVTSSPMSPVVVKHQWDGLTAPVEERFTANHIFLEKTDIWIDAVGTAGGGVIEVDYDILLVTDQ